jgi:hypothetical protein
MDVFDLRYHEEQSGVGALHSQLERIRMKKGGKVLLISLVTVCVLLIVAINFTIG